MKYRWDIPIPPGACLISVFTFARTSALNSLLQLLTMLLFQRYHSLEFAFASLGAWFGFLFFMAATGTDLIKQIYKSFGEKEGLSVVTNHKIAGTAHALNYILHLLVAVVGGGYLVGTWEATGGGMGIPVPLCAHSWLLTDMRSFNRRQ